MARAGEVVRGCLELCWPVKCRPGVTTEELDRLAEKFIRSKRGVPTFKGYHGFPGSICASPNAMVVHGIPGPVRLEKGDIIGIDVGVTIEGYMADAAMTVPVGDISAEAQELLRVTEESLYEGDRPVQGGQPRGRHLPRGAGARGGARVLGREGMVGHGVGRTCTRIRRCPTSGRQDQGPELREGMVIAIEPMVNAGGYEVEEGEDGWAIYTKDRSLSAHFEHTVAITKRRAEDSYRVGSGDRHRRI